MNITNEQTDAARETRRTAIFQDTINGVNDKPAAPAKWWAANGDTLWTAGVAVSSGVDGSGIAFEPGDIVVHSHRLDADSTRTTGGFAIYDYAGKDPLQAVLDEIAKWEHVTPRLSGTVENPGRARLANPATGRPLAMGWSEALANAASHPDETDAAIVRASLLEAGLEMGEKARTGPAVYLLEENGIDLTVIEWSTDEQGRYDAYSFHHEQFDEFAPSPQLMTIGHSDRPEHITPQRMDDRQLMDASRQIFDRYQAWRNDQTPLTKGLAHPVARSGIVRPGDRPLLQLTDGRTAPTWNELLDRTATALVAGKQPSNPVLSPQPASIPTGPQPLSHGTTPQRQPSTARRQPRHDRWPNAWVPNEAAHTYTLHARDGRDWDKMVVRIPAGTTLDGRRLDGYALDCFMSAASKKQKSEGRDVNIRFRPGQSVELFQGRGSQRRSITIDDPAKLCAAISAARKTPGTRTAKPAEPQPQMPTMPDDMHAEAERLLDPANRDQAQPALDLVGFAAERQWNRIDRLQAQLAGYAQSGRFDPNLALKASRRIIDKAAISFEHEHGNPQAKRVADTRFAYADRTNAAVLLLDNLLSPTREHTRNLERQTPPDEARTPQWQSRPYPNTGGTPTARQTREHAATRQPEAAEPPAEKAPRPKTESRERPEEKTRGDLKTFFAGLRSRVGAALSSNTERQERVSHDRERSHGHGL